MCDHGVVSATADLLLHPVRLRIVQALLDGARMSTVELSAALPEISKATLYRHVAVLAEAGVLEVVGEQRIRGAVERTYALRRAAAELPPEELAAMSRDEHRDAFMAFSAGLLASFDRYLARDDVDLARDGVGYRINALWLSDDEFAAFAADLRAAFAARAANGPGDGRTRRLVAITVMPG
jgi:DNA-binding transcriptional ArsR family regulator